MNQKESNQKGVIGYYQHINLGIVEINDTCLKLQNINPDETSIFVIHNGEIKEVTKSAIHPLKLQKQKDN